MPPRGKMSGEIYEKPPQVRDYHYIFRSRQKNKETKYLQESDKPNPSKAIQANKSKPVDRTNIQCGLYKMDTILEGHKVIDCRGVLDFKFKTKLLSDEHHEMMNDTPSIKLPSKYSAYASNPFNSDLYTIVLYQKQVGLVYRAQIRDLYNVTDIDGERLLLRCDLILIDTGEYLSNISYDCIYDFSQRINYLVTVPSEVKFAQLCIPATRRVDTRIRDLNQQFKKFVNEKKESNLKIKILNYKDEIYHVDLIDETGTSIISMLGHKFPDIIPGEHVTDVPYLLGFSQVEQMKTYRNAKTNADANPGRPNYIGAYAYFQNKLRAIEEKDRNGSHESKRLFKVRITDKSDPSSIHIIPADPEFVKFHTKFRQELEQLPSIREADSMIPQEFKSFFVGELILFKPKHQRERKLGNWLRGIVVKISSFNSFTNCKVSKTANNLADPLEFERLVKNGYLDADHIIYGIRSVDYGFQTVATFRTMLHLQRGEFHQFVRTAPWSMRCNLFGVNPLDDRVTMEREPNTKLSNLCLDMIDCWIRERANNDNPLAYFKVLFREDLINVGVKRVFRQPFSISLFHREEPVYCRGPIKTPYECLNNYLIHRGFATNTVPGKGVCSDVQLDQHVINVLASHGRI